MGEWQHYYEVPKIVPASNALIGIGVGGQFFMSKQPTCLDLFAGAGGFSLGFQDAGFDVFAKVEMDDWACDTLRYNFPDSRIFHRDIASFKTREIDREFQKGVDLIIGGPPCQGYSLCRRGKGEPADPRNALIFEFLKFVDVLKPKLFLIENVANLAKAKNEKGEFVRDVLRDEIENLGYHFNIAILNAAEYGVPQLRERCFILGSLDPIKEPFPAATHSISGAYDLLGDMQPTPSLIDAIGDLPHLKAGEGEEVSEYDESEVSEYAEQLKDGCTQLFNHKAMNHTKRMVERFESMSCGQSVSDVREELRPRKRNSEETSRKLYDQCNRRLHPNRPSHTIPASFYANFVHPFQHRNFTAREGARIQSFPDSFRFLGKPTLVSRKLLEREGRSGELHLCQYNQIGNSVPPLLARTIGRHLRGVL